MTGQTLKFHPSVIVEGMVQVLIMLVIIVITMRVIDLTTSLIVLALGTAGASIFFYRQWALTTVTFGENEVVVRRETLFKLKKNIPYSKIASVNVNRGVINRIFGTSKLMVNINSGHNAVVPEATMTFKQDVAERVRSDLSVRLHGGEMAVEEDEYTEPLVRFSTKDVVIHGLFSVPTSQTIIGTLFLAYSVFELYLTATKDIQAGGTAIVSLIMFFFFQGLPTLSHIIRYYDFKVYRKGDTIHLEHGLIRTYRTSFSVHKINAVRVKSSLAARLMHRSGIEAEVVGIGAGNGEDSSRPAISLLKDDATTQRMLRQLVPEFIQEREGEKQPRGAWNTLLVESAVASVVLTTIMAIPSIAVLNELAARPVSGVIGAVLPYVLPLATIVAIAAIFYGARASYRVREIEIGDSLFTFVNGVLDREVVTMNYDKVQMVHVTKGPIARLFGVSQGKVFLLSSTGTKSISSGLFPEDRLEEINRVVMERLATGKYDPFKNSI